MKIQQRAQELSNKIRFLRPFEKSILETLLILTLVAILFYLPHLLSPNLLLNRGNDLETFFWPLYSYVKNQILTNGQIPLINNMYFAGTPLLSDPQAPYFYLPNLLFLIVPINTGFFISFFLHSVFSGLTAYLCAKKGFGLTEKASLIAGILYMTAPKFSGYLEAGHVGLIYSWAWIPIVLLCLIKLIQKPNFKLSFFFGIALSSIFFTHLVTFLIVLVSSAVYVIVSLFYISLKNKKGVIIYLVLGSLIAFGLVAVSLIPQIEWGNQSTRLLLLKDRDVYPKWSTYREFTLNIVNPILTGQYPDSEKYIPFGLFTILSLVLLFFKTGKKYKILFFVILIPVIFLALNNKSPLYEILLSIDYYSLLRVSTRFWFIVALFSSFGIGYLYNKFTNNNVFLEILMIFVISEQILTSWWYISKPFKLQADVAPKELLNYINEDKDLFRVTCTTRCITAKDAFLNNIELIEGYNTVQQNNFNKEAWQLTGSYWNYYTLSIPPFGSYLSGKPKPDPMALGKYNVKYIISPYSLKSSKLALLNEYRKNDAVFFLYLNKEYKSRSYNLGGSKQLEISAYTPNKIIVNTTKNTKRNIVVSEVYSKGWKPFLNGTSKSEVQETPDALIQIDINENTTFVELRYQPFGFVLGVMITSITLLTCICGVLLNQFRRSMRVSIPYLTDFLKPIDDES